MKKLINFIRLLSHVKFKIFKKKNIKIIVLDDEEKSENRILLKKHLKKTFFLTTRFYAINIIFLNFEILINTFKYLIRGNFSLSSYFASLIEFIKPKIILTTCDNSHHFFKTAKILHKEFKFIAIQRSSRDSVVKLSKSLKEIIFIPEYFCFGEYEKTFYKAIGANISKFKPMGSYHFSNFERSTNIKKIKEIYDICLIAEIPYKHNFDYDKEGQKLAIFTKKFSEKFNLKVVVAGKRRRNKTKRLIMGERTGTIKKGTFDTEYSFYTKIFGKKNYKDNIESQFTSYKAALKSKVVIGMSSTMLREMLAVGKKIFVWSSKKHLKFRTGFPIKGICLLRCNDYYEFEKRLKKIINISKQKYFSQLSNDPKKLVLYDKNKSTNEKIINEIEKYIIK